MDIGNRVRNYRKNKNWTILDLSKKAGVTSSMISQIERNICSPSLSLLRKIAEAFEIPVWVLLYDDEMNEPSLIRKKDRKTIAIGDNGQLIQAYLTPRRNQFNGKDHQLEIIYDEWAPGLEGGFMQHKGEEAVFILHGQLEAVIGDNTYLLNEGDCIFYLPEVPHNLKNVGTETVQFLTIITPPEF